MSPNGGLDLRCPTCRRRIEDEPDCPRCGTEMETLRRIAEAAHRYVAEGWRRLHAAGGQPDGARAALGAFEAAQRLRVTEEARRGRIVALTAGRRLPEAAGLMMAGFRADEPRPAD
jgi:hypothetical protein